MKLWQWLNGKKTQIGLWFYLAQDTIIPIWFENGVPPTLHKVLLTISAILIAVGVGHKGKKAGII